MDFEYFIARRQFNNSNDKNQISGSLANVAVFGIALCLIVMIVAISIVTGFKREIQNKIVGFGAHIQLVNYDSNVSFEMQPIKKDLPFLSALKALPGVAHIQQFGTKAGIIKTDNQIQGVVFKGVGPDFDWSFFNNCMVEGSSFTISDSVRTNKVAISMQLAKLLNLKLNDAFVMYFIQEQARFRKFTIAGIYETSVDEMDKTFIIGDIAHVRKLNGWDSTQISGYEVAIDDFSAIDDMAFKIADLAGSTMLPDGNFIRVASIKEKYPQIFDWLNLQDLNVTIILIIMLVVAGFNMISGLLILILDKTNMIGLLKALGASNKSVRRVFLYQSGFLILRGLFWGNLIGLGLCFLQKYTHLLKLDAASYYISHVPINLNIAHILLLNVGTIVVTFLMLWLPSLIISRFSPAETIRYN